ncbi:ankyrin repeat domain-containing protein 6 isoform X2 [Girardinichthys multiradiatus]|uniref:ankyrin repeat domain-containing protein 6 isoform X2 n=1 Tax=Girardinichthys multiradiatus TaxID=208333 RepID=UPI001FADE6B4|nr:ankyrin repeat domain-containing protein 6 isoform X2 [Girardinichthys multiradiatus]
MAAFCSRNSCKSSDLENMVCMLSLAEEVENPSVMKDHSRTEDGEAIHLKVSGHQTALHRSAMVGNSETMAALIAGGCAVDLQNPLGNTALHEVSWHGFTQCVKLLVKAGADVHVKNKAGNTALHLACQNAHAPTAQLLLLGASNPNTKNKVGDTCLHMAACYNNLNLLKILLRSQCCLNETNQAGDTAMHVAAALNHSKAVQLLLSAGLNVRVRNKAGKTALDKAREHESKHVVLLLSKNPQVRYMRRKTMKRPRLRAPTRPAKDSSCGMEQTEPGPDSKDLDKDDLTSGRKQNKMQKNELWDEGGKPCQLYTLYRDGEGRVRQAPARSCLCESLLKKLRDNLKTTEVDLRLHILTVQEELCRQMDRMERRNKHQEKAASERRSITSRMEQRAAQAQAEGLRNQAALRHELKTWCLSLLEYMNISVPAETQYQNLLLSPSAAETDPELVPLLFSGDSSPTASTTTLRPRCSESSKSAEQTRSRTYFEMKMDKCAETVQIQNLQSSSDLPTVSAAPSWHFAVLQNHLDSADYKEEPSSSNMSSTGPQEEVRGPTNDNMILEFLVDRPAEPTFIQERKHLHAMEVTQRFFDAVSAQMERWCSRKILEVEWQSEVIARAERKEMLQRIRELEEEIHRLQTNEGKESFLRQNKPACGLSPVGTEGLP